MEKIKKKLCHFDLLAPGRLRTTYMKCGNPNCVCHSDKKALHSPYHLWDRKVGTKLSSKMVSSDERKKISALLAEAIKISQEIIAEGIDENRRKK